MRRINDPPGFLPLQWHIEFAFDAGAQQSLELRETEDQVQDEHSNPYPWDPFAAVAIVGPGLGKTILPGPWLGTDPKRTPGSLELCKYPPNDVESAMIRKRMKSSPSLFRGTFLLHHRHSSHHRRLPRRRHWLLHRHPHCYCCSSRRRSKLHCRRHHHHHHRHHRHCKQPLHRHRQRIDHRRQRFGNRLGHRPPNDLRHHRP
mmetsp:Transcript_35185/g.52317  ORF Transcript_35185/g.52317 Transcript_35185/m.52317 type:complete len:202 (+) Transcript_35185:1794-2399(+)